MDQESAINVYTIQYIAFIKELCNIRDKVVYRELSFLEANTLIELICTN